MLVGNGCRATQLPGDEGIKMWRTYH